MLWMMVKLLEGSPPFILRVSVSGRQQAYAVQPTSNNAPKSASAEALEIAMLSEAPDGAMCILFREEVAGRKSNTSSGKPSRLNCTLWRCAAKKEGHVLSYGMVDVGYPPETGVAYNSAQHQKRVALFASSMEAIKKEGQKMFDSLE